MILPTVQTPSADHPAQAVAATRPASPSRWLGALAVTLVVTAVIVAVTLFFGTSWAIIVATALALIGIIFFFRRVPAPPQR